MNLLSSNNLIYLSLGTNLLLFLWLILLQISLTKVKKKQSELFRGKKAKDLEEIILQEEKEIALLTKKVKRLFELHNQLDQLAKVGLSKVGMIRFNPFKNLGGNQSFSIAFLNDYNNGLVISSLYSSDNSRLYAKTIQNGQSPKEFPLTEEEKQAIQIAMQR